MRLIDADALMERLGMANECDGCPNCKDAIYCHLTSELVTACEEIADAPTIDTLKHGKWIDGKHMGADGCFVWHRECSICGYEREDGNSDKDTPFCSNCGAKMDEEKDDETN